ncbi:transglutaminase domain-containing protein [Candidatus Woesearchaeota archaeon]|nr:transglutaminase domain-containing protein [Candidatus Woesearchaeota archaeon]
MGIKQIISTAIAAIPLTIGTISCDTFRYHDQTAAVQPQQDEDSLRSAILRYLVQPKFSNADLMQQMTGTAAQVQLLDADKQMLYLSIPVERYTETTLQELSIQPNFVEFGTTSSGEFQGNRLVLGRYLLEKPGHYFFRFPSRNFKIAPNREVRIRFPSATYLLSTDELQGFIGNKSVYGGPLRAITTDASGVRTIISNHGAFVARKGESSLERLVSSLVPQAASREQAAQALLDFVTAELRYNHAEAQGDVEVLKRPNEVLMTKGSDCSGKVILYASLLEQADINYRLVYLDNHITVAVQGDYARTNSLHFNLGEQTFFIAETTVPHFQIGRTRLRNSIGIGDLRCLQQPGDGSVLYDAQTGNPLPFQ